MSARDAGRPAVESPLPVRIGRYRIIERIGKGAMGVVYRARDEQLDRQVAVKVLVTDFAEEPDVRARFYREAQSAGRLLHRNIITIFDLGDDRGRPYIVMELLAGATLSDFVARPDAADLETKVGLMMQVCDGLSTAHAAGIIHRDIKPGNLFVLNDGGLKILDFGVARLVTSSMTVRGHIIGTPSYMSPEQATGRPIDHRSDIFSAGGVFYWMLSGRKPFAAPDLPSVLRKVQLEDPPPLREGEAPAPLARIVFRALAKDPALRYQRISDMFGDLQRFERQLEADALRLGGLAQGNVQAIRSLEDRMAGLRQRLGTGASEAPEPFAALLARYPILAARGLGSLGTLAFRHAVTESIARDLERIRASVEADAAALSGAVRAAEEENERRAAEAERMAREGDRLVQQAAAAIDAGRFDDAQAALEGARRCHRSPDAIDSLAGRLADRQAAAATERELAGRAAAAIESARGLFAERRRPEAIELLEDFLAEHPTASRVQQEIGRLRGEASRASDEERRLAERESLAASAKAAQEVESPRPDAPRLAERERRLAETEQGGGRADDAGTGSARVAELLERARSALRDGALRRAINACRTAEALAPGNADAAAMKADAERRTDRVRLALSQARDARRLERAAGRRLIVARIAMRFGRFRRAYEAATEALSSMPGSPHAAAIRDAAVAAIGADPGLADDTLVGDPGQAGDRESSAPCEETVGTDTTILGRAPD
jgi:tetratricopeptide (TPR) repeat protein